MSKNTGLNLQDSLFIGFCATLLVALTGMLRLKLGISGHSMFLMCFFYLICYGVIGRFGGMLACGALAGLIAMALGVGKGGPMILLKFILPAVAMDLMALLLPLSLGLRWRCILLAIIGCIAWASKGLLTDLLAGMTIEVAVIQYGLSVLKGSFFGVLAALLVPPVLARLKAHDLIHSDKF